MDKKSTCLCFMQRHAIPAGKGLMIIVFAPQQTHFVETSDICVSTALAHRQKSEKASLKSIRLASASPRGDSQQTQRQFSWRMVARKGRRPNGFKASGRSERNDNVGTRRLLCMNGPCSNPSTKENNFVQNTHNSCQRHCRQRGIKALEVFFLQF